MRREIEEIPAVVARLVGEGGARLEAAGRRLAALDPALVATVARGSSDHAAFFLKYAIELTAGIPVASLGPSIASVYGAKLKLAHAACLSISQSGKSPDIVEMAKVARAGGALSFAMTNTASSPLAEAADETIDILAGEEVAVAATKTFVTSAVAGLGLLAYWQGDQALISALRDLPEKLEAAIACDWSALGEAVDGHDSLFILGRGPSMAMANEAALKFKETSSLHAEAYSAAELMHGPVSLVGQGFPVLVLAARDAAQQSAVDTAETLAERGAAVFVTSDGASKARRLPFAATGHPLTEPLSLITSFYGFIEAYARHRGFNPDKPQNLKKVTETR
ncbi:SIS domain-containing protein [Consotaella salsifontis]|nr:SIS domain-containing protein [Consotaella salsifontis]